MAPPDAKLVDIVARKGLRRFPEPVVLASGETSSEFIDGKAALAYGPDLSAACEAVLRAVAGIEFDAVGGLTMGADQFAHVVAVLAERHWFVVRKEAKERGTRRRVEGAELGPGTRVLLVEDVVTTGGSIGAALEEVERTGASVVAAVALVDRGERARSFFASRGIPYVALVTYRDLGIAPVRLEPAPGRD
jgi:orotate phosphoribosyltransferase